MAKLVYALQQSLDGYVDHMRLGPPSPTVFQHFIDLVQSVSGFIYGRRTYEIMRYWEDDQPEWDSEDRTFAELWCSKPKWVGSTSVTSVGPNATLISENLETTVGQLKMELPGELLVGGPVLAQALTELGLIDEYRLYMRPVVLGHGHPFFVGPTPPLRLIGSDLIDDQMIRLCYAPA